MALNKSRGNMYEWVTHTWNPIKGCKYDCSYCYIKANPQYSLEPRFSEREMRVTDLGKNNTIFVGSMCDMFGGWILGEQIERILMKCRAYDNYYLFQSKNPGRFQHFLQLFSKKTILGTTIETNRKIGNVSRAPSTLERACDMSKLYFEKEVTVEPIMDFDTMPMIELIKRCDPKFVAIGADSKGHNLNEPPPEKIRELIEQLKPFTEIKIKKNLRRIYKP